MLIFLISIFLWFKAEKLCAYFLRGRGKEQSNSPHLTSFNVEEFQIISFSIIGLIVLVQTLPQLTNEIPQIMLHFDPYRYHHISYRIRDYALILSLILQIAIGTYLFLGSQGLIGLWRKLRSGAIRRFDDPTP